MVRVPLIQIIFKSEAQAGAQMMLKMMFGPPQREDLRRKTTILRKINPSDCNFMSLGNQNIFLHWGMFAENFPDENFTKLNGTEDEVIIRRSHLYRFVS